MSALRFAALPVLLFVAQGCVASHHAAVPSALGVPSRSAQLLAVIGEPGPLQVETVNAANWKVERSGLINLDNPKAKAAGLEDPPEAIHIFFHVIRHPT